MPLKAGVVQFSPVYGRVNDNLDALESLVEQGVGEGAELLVLPEMAWTGYLWPDPPTILPHAEHAGRGTGQDRLRAWSRRWNVWLVFGFPEVSAGRLFNSQGLMTPDGAVHPVYRKTHLFEADFWWAEPGDTGYLQWPSPWGRLGSGVCMDLNFPDLTEHHKTKGTAILAFSTNWLDQDFDVVPYWEQKLEGEANDGFPGLALFSNRGGEEYGVPFRGQSSVFWNHRCIGTIEGKNDGVLVADLQSLSPK